MTPAEFEVIEAELVATRDDTRVTGFGIAWHGIWLSFTRTDEDPTIVDATIDEIEPFIAHHGLPATHARALELAKANVDDWLADYTEAAALWEAETYEPDDDSAFDSGDWKDSYYRRDA